MQQTPGLEESVSAAEDEEVSQSQSDGGGLCCSLLWVTPVLGLGASSGCRAGQSSYRRAVPVPTSMPTALIKNKPRCFTQPMVQTMSSLRCRYPHTDWSSLKFVSEVHAQACSYLCT